MGKESHYSSKKDRVFVRGIQGQYSLKDELGRLRAMPRVIKGKDLLFNDGPQSFSKHFIEPEDGLAQTLHVSLPTVKTHVSRILTKLGARDRTQLVVLAYESGLVATA